MFSKVNLGTIPYYYSDFHYSEVIQFSLQLNYNRGLNTTYGSFQRTYIPQEWLVSYCKRRQMRFWEHQCESSKSQQKQDSMLQQRLLHSVLQWVSQTFPAQT